MKTYEEIQNAFKFLPVQAALNRIKNKKHSPADMNLIASIVNDDYTIPIDIQFNEEKKIVYIARNYNAETKKFYAMSCFHIPDVFQGV